MLLPSPSDPPASLPMPLVRLAKLRKAIDREAVDKSLAVEIRKDLPAYYGRFREIALDGDDQQAVNALKYLIDRVAGSPQQHGQANTSGQGHSVAVQVNVGLVEDVTNAIRERLRNPQKPQETQETAFHETTHKSDAPAA
jgi:hypothetical protein